MNKILIIIQREYLTRVKKKSFLLLTLLMPFIFAALIFVPIWLASFQGDEVKTVFVVDRTGQYDSLLTDCGNYRFTSVPDEQNSFYSDESPAEAVVVISGNLLENPEAVSINSSKTVPVDLLQIVSNAVNEKVRSDKLARYDVPQIDSILVDAQSTVNVRTVMKNEEGNEKFSSTDVAMGAGFIFTMLIYFFVTTYGALVMQSVMEEKTNRIVELMVSSVKPFQLLMGKIVGIALVGFTQLLFWGVIVAVALGVAQAMDSLPEQVALIFSAIGELPLFELTTLFVVYFIGGYLLYASIFAAVGASVNAQEDSQQFVVPIVLILLFGFYAALYSVENTDGPLAFWTSLIPITSPIVMMVRIPFGVPLWQELLSVGILFATAIAFVWLSGRIYRIGILMYGKKPSIKEMLRWTRYK